jgi:hypothetical protein
MRPAQLRPHPTATLLLASLLATVAPTAAHAEDILGMYIGGAVGQAKVKVDSGGYAFEAFKENHSAFKAMVGVRPIAPIGAEMEYFDFGHPNGSVGGAPADASMKGTAAFAVGYLPLPFGAIFLKAGLARLQSTLTGSPAITVPVCQPGNNCGTGNGLFSLNRTNTSSAFGVGAQFKLGAWAVRGEVERFNAGGQNPVLASLGVTWTFF